MDWIIPLLVIDGVPRLQRAAIAEQLLTVALPGPSSQRLAVAAIAAEQQAKRQIVVERNMVQEAVRAAHIRDPQMLEQECPELSRAFTALPPDVQAEIIFDTTAKPAAAKPALARSTSEKPTAT
jgi:hypothetical protein